MKSSPGERHKRTIDDRAYQGEMNGKKEEILEALADYRVQCNENKRLRRMQRDWSRLLPFVAEDTGDIFTMDVVKGEIVSYEAGEGYARRHRDRLEQTCATCSGGPQPVAEIPAGEIKVKASQEDVVRLDAITMIIWPDV